MSINLTKADPRSRFEFEYSFKGPYIAQTDGLVPFWSYHGHAIAGDENVRLAPSLRSRQGSSEFFSGLGRIFSCYEDKVL